MNFYATRSRTARIGLLTGLGLIVLLTAASLWWLVTPRQQLLFGNLREAAAAEIVQSLDEWKVPYEIVDGGSSITVAADIVYETRMKLVSAGVPRGGHVGFELFDDSDFGITEFAQRVNYQRALQGEIERTITSMPGVETARVHLTIRRPGLFVGERETSKASVAVTLLPGESLSRRQVSGIRSLVASAVEGLGPDSVSVLDAGGTLLSGASGAIGGASVDERDDEETRLEARVQARIAELLGQVLRDEEFRVSVDISLNFDTVREVNERPVAQGASGTGLLSRKRVNSSDAADSSNGRSQNQEETEFVHGTARQEISRAPGRVERMSVAVILPPGLDEHQVARIHSLVIAAAGLDIERGDRLEVSRLGRDERWRAAPSPADARAQDSGMPMVIDASSPVPWLKRLPVLALGLLLGLIAALAVQRRPRALRPGERDAVLAKLRVWLADGTVVS